MSDIIHQIREVAWRFQMRNATKPERIYIGMSKWDEFNNDEYIQELRRWSVADPVYSGPPKFEGMEMLRVLDSPDHLAAG